MLMEWISWSVHSEMEVSENSVQNLSEESKKSGKEKRSQADKVGKLKYLLQKDNELAQELSEIKLMLRTIFEGLKTSFNFKKPLIEKIACEDEVDREILQVLFESGSSGLLPKELATKLERFKVTRHQISRRLVRMNKRLMRKLGESVAEQRGWHWALTSFALDAYGDTDLEHGCADTVVVARRSNFDYA
jgi:hypothetical protein